MKRILFFALFLLFILTVGHAQTVEWNADGDGISWEDGDNWDTNSIPCATCDVIIGDDSVVISSVTTIKSLVLYAKTIPSQLFVDTDSELNIENAAEDGIKIQDNSKLYIVGVVDVLASQTNGVAVNLGMLLLDGKGILSIESVLEMGLTVGTMSKVNLGISNGAEPNISINNSAESGIENFGEINVNYGTLLVNKSSDNGIRNAGVFNNDAIINVDSSTLASVFNIGVNAVFTNWGGGTIAAQRGTNGFRNESFFFNDGIINISKSKLNNISGSFRNTGTIHLVGNGGTAPVVELQAKFINVGALNITGIFDYGILNSNNADSLINFGQIYIDDPVYSGIHNVGTSSVVINDLGGSILIKDGAYYIRTEGEFYSNGNIMLINTSPIYTQGIGIYLFGNNAKFTNEGDVECTKLSVGVSNPFSGNEIHNKPNGDFHFMNVSTGVSASGQFNNEGNMVMERTSNNTNSTFLSNSNNTDGFFNSGTIHVKYNYDNSIRNIGSGSLLVNEPNGIIQIDSVEKNPTNPGIGIYNEAQLINRGLIDVRDSTAWSFQHILSSDPILNYGTILSKGFGFYSNSTSATISNFSGGVIEGKGNFTHAGLLENSGRISLENGVLHAGELTNSDTIHVAMGSMEIENVQNQASGLIQVDASNHTAIETSSRFENSGIVRVNSAALFGVRFSQGDSLINGGQIYVKNTETGIHQEDLSGVILNLPAGVIEVDSTTAFAIETQSDIINKGTITMYMVDFGFRSYNTFGASKMENSGNINLENLDYPFQTFQFTNNLVGGEIIIENATFHSSCGQLNNNGFLQIRNSGYGIRLQQIYNTGTIDMSNLTHEGLKNTGVSNNIFHNAASGEVQMNNVNTALHLLDSVQNYGSVSLINCDVGVLGPTKNYGDIYLKNCDLGLSGGFVNKSYGSLIIDSIGTGAILLNESCGYIKTYGGFDVSSSFNNYGFFSHEDSLNSHIQFKNYGFFENTKGIRKGQFFENFGVMTGIIGGKPSLNFSEFNAAYKAVGSATASISGFFSEPELITSAGGFNAPDNSIHFSAAGVLADTLYTLVGYGSGSCYTVMKIPVKQSPNCGGAHPTITSAFNSGNYGFNWHVPESWNEKIVPDDCSKVIIDSRIIVPANTKARAYQLQTNYGKPFEAQLGAILDVNSFN